jgi:hypothetical protein
MRKMIAMIALVTVAIDRETTLRAESSGSRRKSPL